MASPTTLSWSRLVRLGRYFLGRPRAVLEFSWQDFAPTIDIFTDANWAGCKAARKSTSGGVAMLGRCCVKSWSKTQNTIAQRSAESELLATVRGATEGIGLISLAQDIGIKLDVRMHVDASAALGIIERRGVGRVRHLDVGTLWLQEQQLRRILEIRKVEGLKNPGDLFTKNLALERVDTFSGMIGYKFVSGRAAGTAALDHVVTKKVKVERSVDDPCVACSDKSVSLLSQEAKRWFRISPNHLRGSFRNARAHRSPCCTGVSWNSVSRIVTRASPSGRIIRDVRPRDLRITEKQYCNHIDGCSDIVTDVYLDKGSGDA